MFYLSELIQDFKRVQLDNNSQTRQRTFDKHLYADVHIFISYNNWEIDTAQK